MLEVSYKDGITNVRIFEMMTEKPRLLLSVEERKLLYFGHLVRASGKQRTLLDGKIGGKRRKGNTWAKVICSWTGRPYAECVRLTENRIGWTAVIDDLLREMAQ